MSAPPVYVVLSCDVDPDRERFLDGVPPGRLTWRGVDEGIPALKESLRGVRDGAGHEPVFTWFIRADHQINALQGSYGWLASSHAALFASLRASGDELGWHPHFWQQEAAGSPWFQDIEHVAWQVDMLKAAHRELAAAVPEPLRSVRMGWSYHNNETMRTLDELAIAVDLSALPGYRTFNPRRTRAENLFDWFSAPREPYHPSRADYRRPPRGAEQALGLLEVPSFVSGSLAWSVVGGAQLARKTRELARLWEAVRRPTYCINVTAKPRYFAPLVAALRAALRGRGGGGGGGGGGGRWCSRRTSIPTSWCPTTARYTTWPRRGRTSRPCWARVTRRARRSHSCRRGGSPRSWRHSPLARRVPDACVPAS